MAHGRELLTGQNFIYCVFLLINTYRAWQSSRPIPYFFGYKTELSVSRMTPNM